MLELTIRVLPSGSRKARYNIARFLIYNDLSGTSEIGNYQVQIFGSDFKKRRVLFRLEGFNRSLGAIALIRSVIDRWLATGRDLRQEEFDEAFALFLSKQ